MIERARTSVRRIVGRSRRRQVGLVGALAVAGLMAVGLVGVAFAVHDEGFQLEGNATAADLTYGASTSGPAQHPAGTLQNEFAGPYDWDSLFTVSGTPAPGNAQGTVTGHVNPLPGDFTGADFQKDFVNTGTTFVTSDTTTFATGSKDILDIPGWQCNTDHNVNSKIDIINGFAAVAETASAKLFYYGLEKDKNNGDNNVALWLFQDPTVGCTSTGGAVTFTGHHINGDLLIVSAFTNGGGVSNIDIYQWLNGALDPIPPSGIDCLVTGGNDAACATVNEKTISMPWLTADNGVVNASHPSPNFFEGGINLTAFPEFADACFNKYLLDTRSSQSLQATLFDYVEGNISTCRPDLHLVKTPDSGTYFQGQTFNWDIAVSNTGNGAATGAVVTDTIATGLTIGTPTTPAGTCGKVGQVVTCTVNVDVGATIHITVPVTVTGGVFSQPSDACVPVNNSATVVIGDDTSTDTGQVTACRLTVEKTATPTFTRTITWDIDKSVTPSSFDLFDGQTGTAHYSVVVTKHVTDSDWAVSGTITVHNPATIAATLSSLTDTISGAGAPAVTPDCASLTVPAGGDLVCTYSADLPDAATRTNTATATAYTVDYTGTASIDFSGVTPTVVGDDTINVTDDVQGDLGSTSTTHTFTYDRVEDCSDITYTDGVGTKHLPNTATIVETQQSDSAAVDVTCYRLDVTKTATPTFNRLFEWTIAKSGDKTEVTANFGDQVVVNYAITVVGTQTDSGWHVTGTVTVHNPAPMAATLTSLTDEISGVGAVTLDCGGSLTVPAGGDLVCTYSSDLPDGATRTNTATATAYTKTYSGDAAIDFSGVSPTVTGQEPPVTVTDTFQGTLGTADIGTTTFTYSRTIDTTTLGCGDFNFPNTATIVETAQSSNWNVLIHVINCGTPGKTPGFWGNQNGHAILDQNNDGLLDTPVTIGSGSHTFTVTTIAQSDKILRNSDCQGGSPTIFTCNGPGGLLPKINTNSFEELGAQTLALTYNINNISGFSGQTLSALSVQAYITPTLQALGLSSSSTVNDLLNVANGVIGNSFKGGGTATQQQIGDLNALLGQVNRETL